MNTLNKKILRINNQTYNIEVFQRISHAKKAPRLIVVAHQPNKTAQAILQVCIKAIQRYTPELHELWVVDNNSPWKNTKWLLEWPDINVALNRTEPFSPEMKRILNRLKSRFKGKPGQRSSGSYANAIGLEIAIRLIDQQSHYVMPLHMDTMPCRNGWLSFLLGKLRDNTVASGVCLQTARVPEGILHVSGYIVDFQVFKKLNLDFLPRLPQYDVGDWVTVALRNAGYNIFACPSTYEEPQLVEKIPISSPLYRMHINRSFDDDDNIIFLHLGRGIVKSVGLYNKMGRTTPEEWVRFAKEHLLT